MSLARTMTGMDCVMVASRSCAVPAPLPVPPPSSGYSSWVLPPPWSGSVEIPLRIVADRACEPSVCTVMVSESTGMLSCFVSRIEADDPLRAERRARWRAASGTWRLMVLAAEADFIV